MSFEKLGDDSDYSDLESDLDSENSQSDKSASPGSILHPHAPGWAEFDISSLLKPFKTVKFDIDWRWPSFQLSNYAFKASMWLRSPASVERLPTEILVEVFKYLSWKDILSSRQSCKRLFEISTARPLWVSLFHRIFRDFRSPPILEGPINIYTSKELEQVVLRRVSSEICWKSRSPAKLYRIPEDGPAGITTRNISILIVEGGRWLLTVSQVPRAARQILAYDLDKRFPQEPQCLIALDPSNPEPYWDMQTDVDHTEPTFTFNISLVPDPNLTQKTRDATLSPPEILIYRVCLVGHGFEATLVAHKIKSMQGAGMETTLLQSLHGQYLARSMGEIETCIEICNWAQSGPLVHTKSYIFYADPLPKHMFLLPNDKFIVIWRHRISVYNTAKLRLAPRDQIDRESPLQPFWTHMNTSIEPVTVSKPCWDTNGARISIGTRKGIFGLKIPFSGDEAPSYTQISNLEITPKYHYCLGINKIYSHNGYGVVRLANYTWPDDCDDGEDPVLSPPPPGWRKWRSHDIWSNITYLDEHSNRIIKLAAGYWAFIDFAFD